jgi:hypothetical protein
MSAALQEKLPPTEVATLKERRRAFRPKTFGWQKMINSD